MYIRGVSKRSPRLSLQKHYASEHSLKLLEAPIQLKCCDLNRGDFAYSENSLSFFAQVSLFIEHPTRRDDSTQQLANNLLSQFSYRFLMLFLHTFHHFVTHSTREFNLDTPELAQRGTASVSTQKTFAIRDLRSFRIGSSSKTISSLSVVAVGSIDIYTGAQVSKDRVKSPLTFGC